MKKMKSVTIATAIVAVLTVGVIIAVAQMSHKGGIGQHSKGFMNHHEQFIDHVSDKLKLTNQQKTQAKQILVDSKSRFQPLLERLKETHKTSVDLGANGVFDEQKSQEVADRQAEIVKQLLVEKEKTKAALFAILTSEQREQAKQMMNDFVENFDH
jgi:Spy/CpxP family protein refolding chaperone